MIDSHSQIMLPARYQANAVVPATQDLFSFISGFDTASPSSLAGAAQLEPEPLEHIDLPALEHSGPRQGSSDPSCPGSSSGELEGSMPKQRRAAGRQQSKLEKEREKSRRAQKRYRERQKSKLEEYKASVDALTSQVSTLLQDKQTLENRNSLLEKVVRMQHTSAPQQPPQQPSTPQAAKSTDAAGPLDNEALRKTFEFYDLLNVKVTAEELATRTPRDHIKIYEIYIRQMDTHFRHEQGDPASLRRAMRVSQLLRDLTKILPPDRTMECTAIMKSQARAQHGPPDPKIWPRMLAALNLSPMQKQQALEARHTLLSTIGSIIDERRKIIAKLQAAMPTTEPDEMDAVRFLAAARAGEQLRAGIQREQAAIIEFMHGITLEVLTPMQEARCLVEAQPWLPDMLALTGELAAAEAGGRALAAQASEDYLHSHGFDLKQEPAFSAILAPTAGTPPGSDIRFLEAFMAGRPPLMNGSFPGYAGMFTFSNRY